MSNLKIQTNRQLALELAIKISLSGVGSHKDIISKADYFYEWLQKGPQKDEDSKINFL
jgi:hypothetical protein